MPDCSNSCNQAVLRINKPSFLRMGIILDLLRNRSSGIPSSPHHPGDFHIN
jgi:hypothetical protein